MEVDRAQAGVGALGDMGVHLVDLVRWNFGEIDWVLAHAGIAYPARIVPEVGKSTDTEDFCTVMGELRLGRARHANHQPRPQRRRRARASKRMAAVARSGFELDREGAHVGTAAHVSRRIGRGLRASARPNGTLPHGG